MLYSALKDSTPGSEYPFPNQEIIIAFKEQIQMYNILDF
jgi:hypothetical protein